MRYKLSFGKFVDHQMNDVYGASFNSEDPMSKFEHHLKTKKMDGGDFSDCDYIKLVDQYMFGDMVAIDILR